MCLVTIIRKNRNARPREIAMSTRTIKMLNNNFSIIKFVKTSTACIMNFYRSIILNFEA